MTPVGLEGGVVLSSTLPDKPTIIAIVTDAAGFDGMPAFGGTLTAEEIDAIADYVIATIITPA